MVTIDHKRGDTFQLSVAVLDDAGAAQICTGWSVASQVRTSDYQAVSTLTHAWVSQAGGTYTLTDTATTDWPVGDLVCDIQYTVAGVITSTETFTIQCQMEVTQ